jgi:hypothetical protein
MCPPSMVSIQTVPFSSIPTFQMDAPESHEEADR